LFFEPKNLSGVDPHALKNTIAIQQAMIKDAYNGLFFGNQSTANIDLNAHNFFVRLSYETDTVYLFCRRRGAVIFRPIASVAKIMPRRDDVTVHASL
jgi:uncharacterized protein (DUF2235 family)